MKKYFVAVILLVLIISQTLIIYASSDYSNIKAKVVQNNGIEELETDDNIKIKIQKITLRILEGEYKDEECDVEYILQENTKSINSKSQLSVGTELIIDIQEKDGEINNITIKEMVRQNYLIYMFLIIILALIIFEGKRNIKSIIAFLLILACIYLIFILPVLKGKDIIIMSVITSIIITMINSISQIKLRKNIFITVISTTISVSICVLLSKIFIDVLKISGESLFNTSIYNIDFNIKQLLYAGAIISSTGIVSTISNYIILQYNNTNAIKTEQFEITRKEVYMNGINFGMSFIYKIINIPIIISLCGAATLTSIFTKNINNECIIIMIIYLFNISMSAILATPITSVLYSLLNINKTTYKTKPDSKIEGQRSLKF